MRRSPTNESGLNEFELFKINPPVMLGLKNKKPPINAMIANIVAVFLVLKRFSFFILYKEKGISKPN